MPHSEMLSTAIETLITYTNRHQVQHRPHAVFANAYCLVNLLQHPKLTLPTVSWTQAIDGLIQWLTWLDRQCQGVEHREQLHTWVIQVRNTLEKRAKLAASPEIQTLQGLLDMCTENALRSGAQGGNPYGELELNRWSDSGRLPGAHNKHRTTFIRFLDQALEKKETDATLAEVVHRRCALDVVLSYFNVALRQKAVSVEAGLDALADLMDRMLVDSAHYPNRMEFSRVVQRYVLLLADVLPVNFYKYEDSDGYSAQPAITCLNRLIGLAKQLADASAARLPTLMSHLLSLSAALSTSRVEVREETLTPFAQLEAIATHFSKDVSPVSRQRQATQEALALLNQLWQASKRILGPAPCDAALLALGSTSRLDRTPFSDVELALIHSAYESHHTAKGHQQRTYQRALLLLFELQVVALNQTPSLSSSGDTDKEGFRLDNSTHLITSELYGTVEDLLAKKVWYALYDQNQHECDATRLIEDTSLLSLVKPVLINQHEAPAQALFSQYLSAIREYLDSPLSTPLPRVLTSEALITPCDSYQQLCAHYLPRAVGYPNARYRHALARFVWLDVLQKSTTMLEEGSNAVANYQPERCGSLEPPCVNLKQVYYKPFAYLALCLQLEAGLEAKACHPAEVWTYLKQQGHLAEDTVELLQTALAHIIDLRIRWHLVHGKQEEVAWHPALQQQEEGPRPAQQLTKQDRATLLILKSLIQTLKTSLEGTLCKEEPPQLSAALTSLVPEYLAAREQLHSVTQPLTDSPMHPLLKLFPHRPSPSGWAPTGYLSYHAWLHGLNAFKAPAIPTAFCLVQGLPPQTQHVARPAPTSVFDTLFDKTTARPRGHPDYTSPCNTVQRVTLAGQPYFVKCYQQDHLSLLGYDCLVQIIHRRLGGAPQVAWGWPMEFRVTDAQHKQHIHWAWVSEGIEGELLANTLTCNPQRLTKLDRLGYSQLFLLALLTYPEDGQPRNFIISPISPQRYRLIAIDLAHAFVNPQRTEKKWVSSNIEHLDLKTMVFLLPMMDTPLSTEVLQWVLDLDITEWLTALKSEVAAMNAHFKPLLTEQFKFLPRHTQTAHTQLIQVPDALYPLMEMQLSWLQRLVKQATVQRQNMTPYTLLEKMMPLVAGQYRKHIGRIKTDNDYYQLTPQAYVRDPKTQRMHSATHWKQLQARCLNPNILSRQLGLAEDFFHSVDFKTLWETHADEHAARSQQNFYLALMAKVTFTTSLNLTHCRVLTDNKLETLLKNASQLKSINLAYCPGITDKSWTNLIRYCRNIECIDLSGNTQLTQLNFSFFYPKPATLTELAVRNCTGLTAIAQSIPREQIDCTHCNHLDFVWEATYHNNRGNALYQLKRYAAAVEAFDRAIVIDPNNADYHFNRGNALCHLKRHVEAVEAFDRALVIDPNNTNYHFSRGSALYTLKRYEEAVEAYDRTLMLNPNNSYYHFNRRIALFHLNRDKEALAALKQVISLNLPRERREEAAALRAQTIARQMQAAAHGHGVLLVSPTTPNPLPAVNSDAVTIDATAVAAGETNLNDTEITEVPHL